MSEIKVADKGKQEAGAESDRISDLPSLVTERILECLPLEEAVRTSVLSRHWRYQWVHLPQLIFDWHFVSKVQPSAAELTTSPKSLDTYTKVINNILLRHVGAVLKFYLYVPWGALPPVDITPWIQFVSTNGVKELTLCYNEKLPSCLHLALGLTHLTLYYQIPTLHPTFTGFPCLTELRLFNTVNSESDIKALESLISSFPQLESLELGPCDSNHDIITIYAPKLQHLVVGTFHTGIRLKGTTQIRTVSLDTGSCWSMIEMCEFLCCLPNVEMLHFTSVYCHDYCIEAPKFSNEFGRLTSLKLESIDVSCCDVIYLALRIMESSPCLQKLEIKDTEYCFSCPDTSLQINEDYNFPSLKYVSMAGLSVLDHDLKVIKLLLGCSPVLEVMTITLKSRKEELDVARQLLRYPRASSKAEIIF